ncbi:MAG: selenocysteine-specific translation elongation factor [Bryobacterales bacterium]|nr:selenocysteine-specific translation elongation factor [Bryobacterales bacterium]
MKNWDFMIHAIVGTAGHIDHGKTALVRALTGIDTDRLEEEKRRGISIDLGFAHLQLASDLSCGFVDVPGHERFVKNMLAGVGGIDLVLLVVAADESIKPQTREHFDICRLLGIPRGIVVITKSDLADPDLIELVKLEIDEFTAGSFLENAPKVAVSAATGAGLAGLKQEIARLAKTIPAKNVSHHFRLPVDRAFSMKGFGAVVTGTLVSGSLRLEQEVEIQPTGRRVRVRGIQVHGKPVTKALAGQRTAVNLGGIDHSELHRGMVLTDPQRFSAAAIVDCSIDLLPTAKPLRHRAPVHFHSGTAEIEAEVRIPSGGRIEPGTKGYARLALREAALLLPGDRFILRMFSPVVTIAGGAVLDIAPPRKLSNAPERLSALESASIPERIRIFVREAPLGASIAALVARTGLTEKELRAAIAAAKLHAMEDHQWVLDPQILAGIQARVKKTLSAFHSQNPLQPGLSKEVLRSRDLAGSPPFFVDALLRITPGIAADGEVIRLSSHKLTLKGDEEQALKKIEDAFAGAGLTVPSAQEVLKACGVDAVRARSLLQILFRDKRVIKVAEDLLFHPSALDTLRQLLAARKGTRFSVPEFKDWTGVSRKYAIPLLEYLDRERITRRDGDSRVIL